MRAKEEREETVDVPYARGLRDEPSIALDPEEGDQPVAEPGFRRRSDHGVSVPDATGRVGCSS